MLVDVLLTPIYQTRLSISDQFRRKADSLRLSLRKLIWIHYTLHGGPNQVIAQIIRSNSWIPNNRSVVRQELQQCVKCSRFTAKSSAPLMGDLPKERIDVPTRAFENMGLDIAEPFLCKPSSKARSQDKIYMAQ